MVVISGLLVLLMVLHTLVELMMYEGRPLLQLLKLFVHFSTCLFSPCHTHASQSDGSYCSMIRLNLFTCNLDFRHSTISKPRDTLSIADRDMKSVAHAVLSVRILMQRRHGAVLSKPRI